MSHAIEVEVLRTKLIEAMKKEFGTDTRRINHALRVLEFAERILQKEKASPRVVLATALLHDIGIQEGERKHGSSAPKWQELEGPPIARRILATLPFTQEEVEHICAIIGSHHSAGVTDSMEFRIIWDADLIVNLEDKSEAPPLDKIKVIIEEKFRTETGKVEARAALLK